MLKKTHLWHLNLTSGRNEGAAADRVKEYKSGFIWYQNANTFLVIFYTLVFTDYSCNHTDWATYYNVYLLNII